MKKGILMLLLAAVVAIPLVMYGTVVVAGAPEGDISIDKAAEAFKGTKRKKTAVTFSHAKHAELAKCLECHHKADEAKLDAGEAPMSCIAESCHGATEGVVDGNKKPDTEDAFHGQCRDCHKANKEKGAPTKCSDCHPK